MTAAAYDCLSAGIVVADHVCDPVDHLPAPGELVTTARMDLTIGGCAANVATDLAKLGLSVGVVGCVGDDVFGRFVRESLEYGGVNCEYLMRSADRDTSGTLVINTRGADRRFIHSIGANAEFTGRELTPDLLSNARVLYLGGYCLYDELSAQNVAAAFRAARAAGVTTLLDVVIPRPGEYLSRLEAVLPWTDVFLPNDDEGRLILGVQDPVRQAAEFRGAGAKAVVVTRGAQGAVLVTEDVTLQAGSYAVDFVDGTGAGDAFAAGFLYGLLNEAELADCLRYGSALGASCVRTRGATTGVLSVDGLRQFIASNELAVEEQKA